MSRRAPSLLLWITLMLAVLSPRPAQAGCSDGVLILLSFGAPGLISNAAFAIYDFAVWDRPDRGVAIAEVASQATIAAVHTIGLSVAIGTAIKGRNRNDALWCWPLAEFAMWAPSVALLAHGGWVLANPPPPVADQPMALSGGLGGGTAGASAVLPSLAPFVTLRPR